MTNLLMYILVVYGITTVIVQSKIFRGIRDFIKKRSSFFYSMVTCMMCTGFWVSLFVSFWLPQTGYIIFDGFLGLGGVWLLHTIQNYLVSSVNMEL